MGIFHSSLFNAFSGFRVVDVKEWSSRRLIEIYVSRQEGAKQVCHRCGEPLEGRMNSRYRIRARHLRLFDWLVIVEFWREKRWCPRCRKIRSERIEFVSETCVHITQEMALWLNRLTEIATVKAVSRLESVDKMTCYRVDKGILTRLLQGYKIPTVTKISVDEVYGRSKKQLRAGEDRDDLFLTVIVDPKTRKVIWVSKSRKKEALDEFFRLIGPEACRRIKVVAADQHKGYALSVKEHCPNAVVVWDRFHLVQRFNEALNDDRKEELRKMPDDPEAQRLLQGKYRYVYLTKASNRNAQDQRHIDRIMALNYKIARLEVIKEHFHKVFTCDDKLDGMAMMAEIYEWSWDAKAMNVWDFIKSIRFDERFLNYFEHKVTTGLSEGINRVIKGLKWAAYGYKDMFYFALKILQKCGYLNSRYAFKIATHRPLTA